MAKSQIIKDLANGVADTQIVLKRTKVLLQGLNHDELLQWVNYEIGGYPDDVTIPKYRRISGHLCGSYIKGSMSCHMKYTQVPLPLGTLSDEIKNALLTANILQGIEALKSMVRKFDESGNGGIEKPLPADFYPVISGANNDPYMVITSASVVLNMPQILNIFPAVENKLLDILSYMEKEFGNLDDLDIDIESKSKDEIEEITNKILVMIYNDYTVTIGDNNEIKDTQIASSIDKN